MGCCTSREAGAGTGDQVHASGIPITSTSSRLPPTTQLLHGDNPLNGNNLATSSRPNKPLRPPSPVPKCPPERALYPWTPTQLAREREAFFDTRVTGDPAVWTTLRHICDSLRAGDVTAAQTVMDAAGLTCPTGRIKSEKPRSGGGAGGSGSSTRAEERERRKGAVFDESGRGYEIPGWVVADPLDLAPEPDPAEVEAEKLGGDEDDDSDDYDEAEAGMDVEEQEQVEGGETRRRKRRRRRDEKGKSRAEDAGPTIRVRARLSDRGSDVLVDVGERQKVRVLVRRIQEQAGDGDGGGGTRLRLFLLGKELAEDKTLRDQGWLEGHIVSAMVLGRQG